MALDPTVLAALIMGGGQLVGGGMRQAFQPKENERLRSGAVAQTEQLNKALEGLITPGQTGLRQQASRVFGDNMDATRANFALSGLTDSSLLTQETSRMHGDMMGNLASEMNQDDLNRTLSLLQVLQNPVYAEAGTRKGGK